MIPYPFNQPHGTAELYGPHLRDTRRDCRFDRVMRMAKTYFDVPIAFISPADAARQWFESIVDRDTSGALHGVALFDHAVVGDDLLQIPDAAEDPRFANHPLVARDPRIRFYVGAPLLSADGVRMGTLCIIDHRPRDLLREHEKAVLRGLAATVMSEVHMRRANDDQGAHDGLHRGAPAGETAPYAVCPTAAKPELATEAQFFFIASLTHRLRTPLNAILGFSEALSKQLFGPIENQKYKEYVEHISDSGRQLTELINAIVDFVKIRNGEVHMDEDWVDISDVVRTCNTALEDRLHRSRLAFSWHPAKNLPHVKADKRRLLQMLMNLVDNSIKYTNEGGRICVTANVRSDGGLTLAVADTGIGIAAKDIEMALVPFGQIDNEKTRSQGGTGIGLATTQQLTALHGGELTIDSEVGVGTTVELRFPPERSLGSVAPFPTDHERAGGQPTGSGILSHPLATA